MQQMSSPNATDNYMSYYQQTMSGYPGFFDSSAWSTSGSDALSYLGNYGQGLSANDYMQQYTGFDYAPTMGFSWPYGDYWTQQPVQDPMKVDLDGQQMTPMDQAYSNFYQQMPDNSQKPVVNGQDNSPVGSAVTPTGTDQQENDVQEIEQGMQMINVNGNSDISQESASETSVHEPTQANVNNSSVNPAPVPSGPPKPMSWAQLASQPAKPAPPQPPKILTKPPVKAAPEISSWDKGAPRANTAPQGQRTTNAWSAPRNQRNGNSAGGSGDRPSHAKQNGSSDAEADPTLSKLKQTNSYNPKSFDLTAKNTRFFVIKSYSEDDIHRAIKYGVWCSTEHGNKRLDAAFKEREGKGPIYLLYSVNGSGHFCGMAQMMSGVDYSTQAGVWTQDKWKGQMDIKWIYVKDVPNGQLRHIRLENNENKPVTNSRDTQEVPPEKGRQVLKIIHQYRHSTSIFDDFGHYEKKEVEEGGDSTEKKKPAKLAVSIQIDKYDAETSRVVIFICEIAYLS